MGYLVLHYRETTERQWITDNEQCFYSPDSLGSLDSLDSLDLLLSYVEEEMGQPQLGQSFTKRAGTHEAESLP